MSDDVEPVAGGTERRASSLALAAWEGRLQDVKRLVQQRADPNALEPHRKARHTPLMAAAASGNERVVAALLLAGADPSIRSPSGVVAADLTTDVVISKMLALFNSELAAELRACNAALSGSSTPDEAAVLVQQRCLALIQNALQGSPDDGRALPERDAMLTGADARKARKLRQEEREAERLQRVAEKAAARRGQDAEDARLQRVAQKAAARRAARAKAGTKQRAQGEDSSAQDSSDESGVEEVKGGSQNGSQGRKRPVKEPPRVERRTCSECVMCASCGVSGERLLCGFCGLNGVCSGCSACGLCGRVSGFCLTPAIAAVPGMFGPSGRPEMSGMSSIEEAFPHAFPKKKKKRRRSGSRKDKKRSRLTKEGQTRSRQSSSGRLDKNGRRGSGSSRSWTSDTGLSSESASLPR